MQIRVVRICKGEKKVFLINVVRVIGYLYEKLNGKWIFIFYNDKFEQIKVKQERFEIIKYLEEDRDKVLILDLVMGFIKII